MNLPTLPFEKFSEQQTRNLWRGAGASVLTVALLNVLVGHPGFWIWIGFFAVFTLGLQQLSKWNVYVAAMMHFVSTLMITAFTVSHPSGLIGNIDPALVFGTVSIPTVMSVSVFFGGFGAVVAALTGVMMLVLLKSTNYLLFASFQIVSIAFFGFAVYTVIKQLEHAKAALERAAMVDALTNLENRRALEANFERYKALADRRGTSLMMTSWDVNDLKRVNDSYGHAAGDAHLRNFANALRLEARAEDAFFRVGGDEFIGLHLGLENATELIERVRTAFPSVAAGWTDITSDLDTALIQADRMMYTHKAALKSNPQNSSKENPYVVA